MKCKWAFFLVSFSVTVSCTYRADVQCTCRGANGVMNSYDLGIQRRPSVPADIARCDTLGAHDNLDTCNLTLMGN